MTAIPVDPTKYPDDLPSDVRNDSGLPVNEVMAALKADGVEITYGDMTMLVERVALEQARKWVATLSLDERPGVMRSVDRALRGAIRKVSKGTASKKRMDNFHDDLLLWTALREVSAQ
jgi:hypothetical protein